MDSFYFGSNGRLFGTYHPATGQLRSHGVVVCAPLFHEYYRSHHTLRKTAAELAGCGYDVIRFDYRGTGDSKGVVPADPFHAWSDDIGEALMELRQLSGCTRASLITTRFSSALALPWRNKTGRYVCWDPVLDHDTYMQSLDAMNAASLSEHTQMPDDVLLELAREDYLGTGFSRSSIGQSIVAFAQDLAARCPNGLPVGSSKIRSPVEWPIASLQTIYAHDTVDQLVGAIQVVRT